jgi:hypothetical protein
VHDNLVHDPEHDRHFLIRPPAGGAVTTALPADPFSRTRRPIVKRMLTGTATGLLCAATMLLGTASASAFTVGKTFSYDCAFPSLGDRVTDVHVTVGIPTTIHGVFPAVPVSASLAVPADLVSTFPAAGATQANGTGTFALDLSTGGTPTHLPFTGTIGMSPVPPAGSMTVVLTGSTSSTPVGTSPFTVSAGTSLGLQLTPRTPSGAPTALGTLPITCTATGGTVLATIVSS